MKSSLRMNWLIAIALVGWLLYLLAPVLIIFAVAAGGQLFGFFGILLALPAAAVLSVLVRFAYNRYLKEHPEIVVDTPSDAS